MGPDSFQLGLRDQCLQASLVLGVNINALMVFENVKVEKITIAAALFAYVAFVLTCRTYSYILGSWFSTLFTVAIEFPFGLERLATEFALKRHLLRFLILVLTRVLVVLTVIDYVDLLDRLLQWRPHSWKNVLPEVLEKCWS